MATVEPRIYRIVLHMDDSKPWSMQQLCKDLSVTAEQQEPIQEDEWGTRGVLELWFQEIEGSNITIHIQKKHSSHKKKYLKELEEFFSDLDNIDYLKDYEEIG
ncbi:hypothetical protein [Methylosarcina fibrata]|uniref:hypothetical protein n=1 Tax=Methylosarcina fibrata TaxID=105972 RepID=UPI0003A4ECF6|nr:hypothetical protein [Methylosarcina fibrata]